MIGYKKGKIRFGGGEPYFRGYERHFKGKGMHSEGERLCGVGLRGSVTVETALIMPVLLLTILSSLYLTIHVRNGTLMTASCIEQAISGRVQENPALFFAGDIDRSEEESSSQRTISMKGATYYFSGQLLWETASRRTYKKYYPVTYLRKIRGAGNLLTGE